MNQIICGDCLDVLPTLEPAQCIFADPPDNIGLDYNSFDDRRPAKDYVNWLFDVVKACLDRAPILWLSFNARWLPAMGFIDGLLNHAVEIKPCVQTFTFGEHNKHDLGNNYRPLWRFRRDDAPLYPDAIRVPSWRLVNGDKRANPAGRVPGDVFDFPRVVGNSKQRRRWHPTQLHEGLVERCIRFSTAPGQRVIDPFGGTGTTLRVCSRLGRPCDLIEIDQHYCQQISFEFPEAAQRVIAEPLSPELQEALAYHDAT